MPHPHPPTASEAVAEAQHFMLAMLAQQKAGNDLLAGKYAKYVQTWAPYATMMLLAEERSAKQRKLLLRQRSGSAGSGERAQSN